jgi:hypothetical protein
MSRSVLSRPSLARGWLASRALWLKLGVGLLVATAAGCAARADVRDDDAPSGPSVTSSEALVHGALDHERHPAVVALVAHDRDGEALCTGTLIAPDVVLTARHCVSYLRSESVDCPARGPQVGENRAPSSIDVILGDDAARGRLAAHGAAIFTPDTDVLCDADIALLRLDRPITGITPLWLAVPRAPSTATSILAVGYGKLGDAGDAGVRRFRVDVPVVSVGKNEFVVGESTCSGDSGGPAIDEEHGGILGVVSRGGMRCDGRGARNVYTRIDPFLDLVARALGHPPKSPGASSSPAGGDMGDACSTGASCAGGVCAQNQYCSRHCGGTAPRCPAGYRCAPVAGSGSATGVCAKKT